MLRVGKHKFIRDVFLRLDQICYFGSKQAADVFPVHLISEMMKLSSDVETVATLLALQREAWFAENFLEKVNYDSLIAGYRQLSKENGVDIEKLILKEADGYVDSAKQYIEEVTRKLDSREIDATPAIRELCSRHAIDMLNSWMQFRLRALTAIHSTSS